MGATITCPSRVCHQRTPAHKWKCECGSNWRACNVHAKWLVHAHAALRKPQANPGSSAQPSTCPNVGIQRPRDGDGDEFSACSSCGSHRPIDMEHFAGLLTKMPR